MLKTRYAAESAVQAMFAEALHHHQAGRLTEAEPLYRRVLTVEPGHVDSLHLMGVIAHQIGQHAPAVSLIGEAIAINPSVALFHCNLGNALSELGRYDEAAASYARALELRAEYPEAYNNLGNMQLRQGLSGEAIACFRRALDIQPAYPDAHNNLGNAFKAQLRFEEAIACFGQALALAPGYAAAHNNLGTVFALQGRLPEAAASYHRAIKLKPEFPEAYNNLGSALAEQEFMEAAAASFTAAIMLRPTYAEAHNNLGNLLKDLGRLGDASDSYLRAIAIKPSFAEAHNNLGNVLKDQGHLEQALAHYTKAAEIRPDFFAALSNALFILNYCEHQPSDALLDLARQFGALASAHVGQAFTAWTARPTDQPLLVGLVSGDLSNHPVGYFLEGLLRNADPKRVEFLAFPTRHREDELTARIKPHFKQWTPIHGLSDEAAARLIHASGVQILLDLSGHTGHNRLPLFAWRPAPVQATWLGYFATTGVAEIDYIIGDPNTAPVAESRHFTEAVWTLPEIYYCCTPPEIAVAVSPLPALTNGFVTFGCFNNLTKINDTVVAVWARILQAVPGSRLMLKAQQLTDHAVRGDIRKRFAACGITEDRVVTDAWSSREDYLQAYHNIDIALDPFPYPGGTTSFEALWMGLPVLTKRGDRFLSHVGETIARNAGLPDWIAADSDDYVAKAIHFASDLGHLAQLRGALRTQVLASPLFDAPRFARHFEAALAGMWQTRRPQPPHAL